MIPYDRFLYFGYITHDGNIQSILDYGILSHDRVRELDIHYHNLSNAEVQSRRARVVLPDQTMLHSYANVYLNPRNAMLRVCQNDESTCILEVRTEVLELPGIWYSDRNASVDGAIFRAPDEAGFMLEHDAIFRKYWVDSEGNKNVDHMQALQAELLIPGRIAPEYIACVRTRSENHRDQLRERIQGVAIECDSGVFFS